jgi:membrane protease YdiL (CAAX protease family)
MKLPVIVAALFYLSMAVGGVVWSFLAGRGNLLWSGQVTLALFGAGLLLGLGSGLLVVGLSRLLERVKRFAELNAWFASILGAPSWGLAFFLALFSSFGEELLFRGAMQGQWGIWVTTVFFALLHMPPKPSLLIWTVAAGVMGLVFSLITAYTHNLMGAIIAHFTINFINLHRIGHHASTSNKDHS